jgi:hypothetical protein
MRTVPRPAAVLASLALCAAALTGCRNVRGVAETRRAVEQAGYRDVAVSFGSGGGIDVVRVDASTPAGSAQPGGPPDDVAAAVWRTLPLRFDRLRVSVKGPGRTVGTVYDHGGLAAMLGPRAQGLDRRQVGDAVVTSGLKLLLVLSVAALASVGLVVAMVLLVMRTARGQLRRPTAAGAQAGAEPSDGAGVPGEAEGPEAIPS